METRAGDSNTTHRCSGSGRKWWKEAESLRQTVSQVYYCLTLHLKKKTCLLFPPAILENFKFFENLRIIETLPLKKKHRAGVTFQVCSAISTKLRPSKIQEIPIPKCLTIIIVGFFFYLKKIIRAAVMKSVMSNYPVGQKLQTNMAWILKKKLPLLLLCGATW